MPFNALILRPAVLAFVLGGAGLALVQTSSPNAQPAPNASETKVLARVDGTAITDADVALAADDPALSLPAMDEAQKRDIIIGYLVDLKIGARAAEAAKVGEGPEFARKLAYFRDKLLLDEYLDREVKKAVTPEATRKLYEDTVKNLKPEPEVHARHILVETEDEAKKVAGRVKGGEDFGKVAGEVSKDPGSKTDGGDLGFFTQDRMVQAFAEAAFKLEAGQISNPVQTQFGWHVIKVEEKRTKPVPGFEDMKEQVENYLTRKTQQDLVLGLRQKAKIERLDEKKPDAPASEQKKP
jgi:peptidyl-prolyl cis-trans isomerase C